MSQLNNIFVKKKLCVLFQSSSNRHCLQIIIKMYKYIIKAYLNDIYYVYILFIPLLQSTMISLLNLIWFVVLIGLWSWLINEVGYYNIYILYIYKIQTTIVMVLHVSSHHTYYFLARTITYLTEKLKSNAKLSRLKLSKSCIHKKVLAGQYTLNSFFLNAQGKV